MVSRQEKRQDKLKSPEQGRSAIMEEADLKTRIIQEWLEEERYLYGYEEVPRLRKWLKDPLFQGRVLWNVGREFNQVLMVLDRLSEGKNRLWIQGTIMELERISAGMMKWNQVLK
jgi:hypothetical protein